MPTKLKPLNTWVNVTDLNRRLQRVHRSLEAGRGRPLNGNRINFVLCEVEQLAALALGRKYPLEPYREYRTERS